MVFKFLKLGELASYFYTALKIYYIYLVTRKSASFAGLSF